MGWWLVLGSAALAAPCEGYADPEQVTLVAAPVLTESSGVAWSRQNPDIWFTHNDSGDGPKVYRFKLSGAFLGALVHPEAAAVDWEDMAAGPCPGASTANCLYLADVGDNAKERETVVIYAVTDPGAAEVPALEPRGTWTVRYPEGKSYDAEALLVHPVTGALTVVTKTKKGKSRVFRLARAPGEGQAVEVARLDLSLEPSDGRKVTGGDWSEDGQHIVLRTYLSAWEWTTNPDEPDAHWSQTPRRVATAVEVQGEAATYDRDGNLITTSEGTPMPVHRSVCRAP